MSETTLETNALEPAAQEASQSLATTTLDAESPLVGQEPEATTINDNAKLGSSPAVVDPNVDATFISDSKPVITESERAPEQVILTEQESTSATPIVALEQPATAAEPGQLGVATSELEAVQVEASPAVATQEATLKPAPNSADSVTPESIAEPAMSATAAHSTPVDPRPAETTDAVTATTAAQSSQSQPARDVQLDAFEEPQNKLTQKFTKAEWRALKEFRVSVLLPTSYGLTDSSPTGPTS
jgi:hypothetical protein